ncbi:serine/threonine protein kinase [Cordyceps javanica]|uniref:Serine/threonine protein kinase n=1 Tax=Cordyceps javanica TaxID=43265 RepID=A0A545UU35_9HYPO|nr:serine/threonine protein kinase [Cordyceps javanica]
MAWVGVYRYRVINVYCRTKTWLDSRILGLSIRPDCQKVSMPQSSRNVQIEKHRSYNHSTTALTCRMSVAHAKRQDANKSAINNTAIRRWLTLVALKTTSRFYKFDGPCVPISSRIIVKKGKNINLAEAESMAFIAAQTKIPLPRIYCSFTRKDITYIVMERVRGKTLADAWPTLSDTELKHVFIQLRHMLEELRAIPAPGTAIQNCMGGSLRDSRILRPEPRFGPFHSTQAFHYWLREGLQPEQKPQHVTDQDWADIKRMVAMQDREWEMPVFTHGDLNPFNIMILNGKIEAIIDWEFSGWLPCYWEYTSAWLGSKTRIAWQNLVATFIDPWPKELEMEAIRQKWWGDF